MRNKFLFSILFLLCSSKAYSLFLGDGTDEYQEEPIFIMDDVIDVYFDGFTTLFRKTDNSLWGCGYNTYGELGNENRITYNSPIKIKDNVNSFCCSAGSVMYTTLEGDLYILGLIPEDLKRDNSINFIKSSTPVFFADNVLKCFVYDQSFFFITWDHELYSFGKNNLGQLGDGSKISRIIPKKILNNVSDITVSEYGYILVLDNDGNVFLCSETLKKIFVNAKKIKGNFIINNNDELFVRGYNIYGSLGLELGKNYAEYVYLMDDIIDMDGNQDHSLIITNENNLLVCGGGNIHQIQKATGDGEVHYTPFHLKSLRNCYKAFVGEVSSFVITLDNELWAFGVNSQDDYSGL